MRNGNATAIEISIESRNFSYEMLLDCTTNAEFSLICRLSEVVQPPEVVRELSWVHRFWPSDAALSSPSLVPPPLAGDVHYEHLRAKPEVALFCLVGMRDSYTDFHIDFGGSSVWYHVFQVWQCCLGRAFVGLDAN
jgi:hypothetical protein